MKINEKDILVPNSYNGNSDCLDFALIGISKDNH
jgi:hypothetical protein